jgi:small-conductance mechanosensitive channel
MAALSVAARPAAGFTGSIAFDDAHQRDTQPSVLAYLDGRAVPYDRQFSHQPARVDARRRDDRTPEVQVAGRYYDVVPIAFSGIRFHSIEDIDINDGTYAADFDVWFRSPMRIEPDDVFFPNAVEGTLKGVVDESLKEDERSYQRLRFKGKFRFEASPKDLLLERITLPLAWRHKQLEVGGLRLVIDSASFNSVAVNAAIHEQIAREKVMAASTGFRPVTSVLGVESRPARALGDPRARGGQLIYSETNLKLVIESTSSSLGPALARRVPASFAIAVALVFLASGFLLWRRKQRSPAVRVLTVLAFSSALLLCEVALFGSSLLVNSPQRWVVWIRYLITMGYYIAGAFMINALIWGFLRRGKSGQMVQGTIHLLTSLAVYAGMFAAYYTNVLGRDVLPILATSSVLLTVVGLALRELILDAISGVAVHMDGSVKVGQWVSVKTSDGNVDGIVEQLGWRTFRIRSRDDRVHFVPNASVVQHGMSNLSLNNGFNRVEIPFEISSGADVGVILEALGRSVPDLLATDPDVDSTRPIQLVCREIDGEGTEMAVQIFFRVGRSVDSLSTRILQTISSVLIRLEALPTQRISLDRPERLPVLAAPV